MFGSNKGNLTKAILDKATVAAESLGCSVDEFVNKAVEEKADRVLSQNASKRAPSQAEVDQIAEQMKGLGYLE